MVTGNSSLAGEQTMNRLLNLSRMARHAGVTQQWLKEQAVCGRIPCLKAGKRLLFNPTAVELALAEQASKRRKGGQDEV